MNNLPYIFAHRGASGYEPDNSFASFDKAIELGADGLETDAFKIATGELIIFHDKSIQLPGEETFLPTHKASLSEIRSFKLENGEEIPEVSEFFERYQSARNKQGNLIRFSIDIQHRKTAEPLAEAVVQYGLEDRVDLCATNPLIFKKLRKKFSNINLVASNLEYLITPENVASNGKLGKVNVKACNIQAKLMNEEINSTLENSEIDLYIWDLHTKDVAKSILSRYSPAAIYSNFPDMAVEVIKNLN